MPTPLDIFHPIITTKLIKTPLFGVEHKNPTMSTVHINTVCYIMKKLLILRLSQRVTSIPSDASRISFLQPTALL